MLQVSKVGYDDDDEEVDHGDRAQDDHRQQEEHGKASAYPIPDADMTKYGRAIIATPCQTLDRALQS